MAWSWRGDKNIKSVTGETADYLVLSPVRTCEALTFEVRKRLYTKSSLRLQFHAMPYVSDCLLVQV